MGRNKLGGVEKRRGGSLDEKDSGHHFLVTLRSTSLRLVYSQVQQTRKC